MKSEYSWFYTLPQERYEEAIGRWYRRWMGETLDLDHPCTFNEKIQWLKLYDSTPIKTRLADKYLVRDWVREKIGAQYLIPLLGVWDDFDEIDFDALPDQFVLKLNAGSGCNVLVPDKSLMDAAKAKERFETWMREEPAFKNGLELHYLNTRRRILAEAFISNDGNDLYDYKVFCFNGKAACILFMSERKTGVKRAFYDVSWNKLAYDSTYQRNDQAVPKPDNLEELIALAEKLSEGFAMVRVDFYRLNDGRFFFGEMTFTPAGGRMQWGTAQQAFYFGSLIQLPERRTMPERKPIISVIMDGVPTAEAMDSAIGALRAQGLEQIEILCPDDGKDAGISQVLRRHAAEDARVKINSAGGMDAASARNAALDAAQGEFVMFVDPRMRMQQELLMTACRQIVDQRADIALIGGDFVRREDGETRIRLPMAAAPAVKSRIFSGKDSSPAALGMAAASVHNKLMRRAWISKAALRFEGGSREDDPAFALSALRACQRITVVGERLLDMEEPDTDPMLFFEDVQRLCAAKPCAQEKELAVEICFSALRRAGGMRYRTLYRFLKDEGWKLLGMADDGQACLENAARRQQISVMLRSDAMIRFE